MKSQEAYMLVGIAVIIFMLATTLLELPGLIFFLLPVIPFVILKNKYKWLHPKPAPKPAFKIFTGWDFYGLDKPFKHFLIVLASIFLIFSLVISYQINEALLSPQKTNGTIIERECYSDEKCSYPTYYIEYRVDGETFSIVSSTSGIRIKSPSPLRIEGKKKGDKVTVIYNKADPKIGILDKEIGSGLRISAQVVGIAFLLLLGALFLPIGKRGNLVRKTKPDTI